MKFTCDSCSAQYMISDDKVGPSGVKVRCKKCGNVVVVRRAVETPDASAAAPAAAQAAPSSAAGGNGLDVELGNAFDNVFGDPAEAKGGPDADADSTQAMGAEDAARIAAAPAAAAPAATEWYVAIGQAQVGPLPLAEVKRKWEGGDIGPDSLVWRPGMGDWQPLSAVAELAGHLAPVPRARAQPARAAPRTEPQPAREAAAPTPAPMGDVTWKPAGASALAALASEEIAARKAPEPKPAAARAAGGPGGARSLVDALPDSGGVDPTGAIPLSIKGMETTGEKKIERRSSIASRAEETRHKRSMMRAVVIGLMVVVVVVGGAAAYLMLQMKKIGAPAGAVATAPTPPVAAPVAAAPTPAPAAAPAPVPAPAPTAALAPEAARPPEAAPPAAPVAAAPAPASPAPPAPPAPPAQKAAPAPSRKAAKGSRKDARHEAPVARADATPPVPATRPPAPAPGGKKKDSLLDFDSNDSALDEALGGGGGGGRTVYVPPARAGARAVPDKLTPAQINESVAGRIEALRKCVSEQKARDPAASGVLKLRWIIGGDGNVRDVKALTGEFASSPFAQCITGVVKTIRFPQSATTGQEVTFPFSF